MALKTRAIFGVHQFTPYKINSADGSDGEFYGTVKCLGGSSMSLSGETVKLEGGSSRYPFASESGRIESTLQLRVKEYPAFLFELCFGKAPTESFASSPGEVIGVANTKGESILDAISAVSIVAPQSAKFGKYVLKAIDSETLAVYCSTDIDFAKGVVGEYLDQSLKVAEITVASGDNEIPGFGIKLVSGAPDFVAGDMAKFEVLPPHSEKLEVIIGGIGDVTPEFGAIVMAEKRGDGSIMALDVFRLKAAGGMNLGFEEAAFSESEINLDALYSSAKGGVFKVISLK
jgi:hypothetical protein